MNGNPPSRAQAHVRRDTDAMLAKPTQYEMMNNPKRRAVVALVEPNIRERTRCKQKSENHAVRHDTIQCDGPKERPRDSMLCFPYFLAHMQSTVKPRKGPGARQHSNIPSNEGVSPSRFDRAASKDVLSSMLLSLSKDDQDNHKDDE
ncbi:MAG: hypothetical protein Q9195_005475 [Heterodermia aff. obscurata]